MNTSEHLSADDLTLFALQLLPEDELKAAVEHLEHCEACRQEVAQIQGDLVVYAMSAEQHSPPAAARERLLRRVAKEPKAVPVEAEPVAAEPVEPVLASRNSILFASDLHEERESSRSGFATFLGWFGWAVAAAACVFAAVQFHQRQALQGTLSAQIARANVASGDALKAQEAMEALTNAGALQVGLHLPPAPNAAPAPPKPEGHAAYMADKGSLVFIAMHLDPVPEYKTYELWVLPSNGHDPMPAGTFKPDASGNASVVMPDLPKGIPAAGFGVTIEDDGGSKTPTSPVVLVGKV